MYSQVQAATNSKIWRPAPPSAAQRLSSTNSLCLSWPMTLLQGPLLDSQARQAIDHISKLAISNLVVDHSGHSNDHPLGPNPTTRSFSLSPPRIEARRRLFSSLALAKPTPQPNPQPCIGRPSRLLCTIQCRNMSRPSLSSDHRLRRRAPRSRIRWATGGIHTSSSRGATWAMPLAHTGSS